MIQLCLVGFPSEPTNFNTTGRAAKVSAWTRSFCVTQNVPPTLLQTKIRLKIINTRPAKCVTNPPDDPAMHSGFSIKTNQLQHNGAGSQSLRLSPVFLRYTERTTYFAANKDSTKNNQYPSRKVCHKPSWCQNYDCCESGEIVHLQQHVDALPPNRLYWVLLRYTEGYSTFHVIKKISKN